MKQGKADSSIRVLLLDGHTVQVLSVLKSLNGSGFLITVFCESRISYGYTSRYPDKKILCPKIKKDEKAFLEFLKSYLSVFPQDVIIPLFDDSASFLNEHRHEIDSYGSKIALPEKSLFTLAFNKSLLMEFCRNNNFSHPATERLCRENLEKACKTIGFPALIKPVSSSGANGIVYLESITALEKVFPGIEERYGTAILQKYIENEGFYYNVMLFRDGSGSFSKAVIIKISRYFPVKGGTGSFSETIENPEIEILCKDILTRLNWRGFADFDLIADKYSKKPFLIEINPRIPACIHASLVSGVNFPLMIVNDVLRLPLPVTNYRINKKVRYLAMDFLWLLFSKERFRSNPSWFKFLDKDLFYQDGCNDLFPMLAGFLMGIRKYMNKEYRQSKLK